MSDGTSRSTFRQIFTYLEDHESNNKPLATYMLKLSQDLAFDMCELGVDPFLAKHDLVRIEWLPDYAEWITVYANDENFDLAIPYEENYWDKPEPQEGK